MSEKPKKDYVDFNDIFDEFFQNSGQNAPPRPWTYPAPDFTVPVRVTPDECAAGIEKDVAYHWLLECEHCHSTGVKPGTPPATICSECQGSGQLRTTKKTFLGTMVHVNSCTVCKGSGKYSPKPCRECHMRGYVWKKDVYHLSIPAGTMPDARFIVPGGGNVRQTDGTRGDVTFVLDVVGDPRKKKKKNDERSFFDRLKGMFGLDK